MPLLALGVLTGDQQLCYRVVIFAEQLVVSIHQLALTDGSGCLLGGDIFGTLPQTQLAHTHADGTGGNEDYLMSCVFNVTHNLAQLLYPADVQMPGGMGQGRGADLYYDTHESASCMSKNNWGHYTTLAR